MNQKIVTTENKRNQTLDVLKGISIFLVILTHFKWSDDQRLMFAFPFWIDMAIPIFIIITGYVNVLSYKKNNVNALREAYNPKILLSKFLRYTIPFIPIFFLEVFANIIFKQKQYNVLSVFKDFIQGGYGPGSYYYPFLLQFIVLMPVAWFVISHFKEKGLIITFAINLFYEIFKNVMGMSDGLYRLIAIRHFFNLSLGCYIIYSKKMKKAYYYILTIIGFASIILLNYSDYEPMFITKWKTTCMFATLFVFPTIKWLIDKNKLKNGLLELMGKASYNIFLVQMFYFSIASEMIYKQIFNPILQMVINIVVCCGGGILFYYIETPATKSIINIVNKLGEKRQNN